MAKKIRWTYEFTQRYLDKFGTFNGIKAGDIEGSIRENDGFRHSPWTTDDLDGILSTHIREGLYVWYQEEEEEEV